MVRHLEEAPENEINRDGDIDAKEIGLLRNYYVPEIIKDIESGKYNKIVIIESDKLRSKRTAEILTEEVSKHTNIPIEQEENSDASAEVHGKYKKGVDTNNPIIKKAKFAFLKEAFDKGNIWYRHGSVVSGLDNETYPEFEQIFESSGENQIELNIRMYRFILELIKKIEENQKTLYILSTHHIVMSTILSMIYMADQDGGLKSFFYNPFGKMYKNEREVTEEMIGGWEKFYEFYKLRNYVFDVDLSKLKSMESAIQSELDIFLAKYMQYYKKKI